MHQEIRYDGYCSTFWVCFSRTKQGLDDRKMNTEGKKCNAVSSLCKLDEFPARLLGNFEDAKEEQINKGNRYKR